jgi:Raf kinase inhibitor-like YbhB/YbcL family protein
MKKPNKADTKKVTSYVLTIAIIISIAFSACQKEDFKNYDYPQLIVECKDFKNGETIPTKFTGRGSDISPEFIFENLSQNGKTIAIIFDDFDHPTQGLFNHWIIWNIPLMDTIPENIPSGKTVAELGNAIQGIGYGKHQYRGPKPPKGRRNKYQFNFFVLDTELNISSNSRKQNLVKAMQRHIIQYGTIYGYFE